MKELIIKIYQDKPSRIGILYGSEYIAGKEYATLISNYLGEHFRARLEVVKDRITLILVSDQSNGKVVYKNLRYKGDQLKKLQAFVKADSEIQFVHIYPVENNLLIAKPNLSKPMEFVSIHQYEIVIDGEYCQ
jgi:hypothetical protein